MRTVLRSPILCLMRPAVVVVLLAGGPAACAQDALRQEMAELAKSLQKQLAGDNEPGVALQAFTGPDDRFPSNAGPGIVLALREELTRLGVKVDPDARVILKGTYEDVIDRSSKRLVIVVAARLVDRSGKTLVEMEKRGVAGDAAVAAIAGVTGVLPLDPPGSKSRDDALAKPIDEPKASISGSRVRAAADSPYAVEVLVKSGDDFKPREARDDKGYAYVPIKRDEVYVVRLVNDSDGDAAVTLTIDGVNAFSFCELRDPKTRLPLFSTFILPPHSAQIVFGWPIDLKQSDEFLVTDYAHGAAAELKAAGAGVGVITAAFAAAWPIDGKPPADEPANVGGGKGVDATGRGAPISTPTKAAPPCKFGVIRAVVSVRYSK